MREKGHTYENKMVIYMKILTIHMKTKGHTYEKKRSYIYAKGFLRLPLGFEKFLFS